MTYKILTKDDKGNVAVFDTANNKADAEAFVKKAAEYWMYVDAWYIRVE